MEAIQIWIEIENDTLTFWQGDRLATIHEFEMGERSPTTFFEALNPGEIIELKEGVFELDEDLGLIEK